MSRSRIALLIFAVVVALGAIVGNLATAGTGASGLIGVKNRVASAPLGSSYFSIRYAHGAVGHTVPGGVKWLLSRAAYDTLRVGRDLDGSGSVDTLGTSSDLVPSSTISILYLGALTDTLWINLLDATGTSGVPTKNGTIKIITPTNNPVIQFPIRVPQIAVTTGRTGGSGNYLIVMSCER